MTRQPLQASNLIPILVCTLGILLLSVMDAAVKDIVVVLGAYNLLLWRSLFATIAAGATWATLSRVSPSAKVLRLHAFRALIVCFVGISFFWGLGKLPLAEAIALSFIAPLVALFFASVLLGETIGTTVIWASVLGLAGVVVIMLGRFSHAGYPPGVLEGMLAVLASAIFYAYNLILSRRQAQVASPLEIAFFQNMAVFVFLCLPAPWLATLLTPDQWLPVIGIAALGLFGHFMMSWAYARAEAQYLIPTEYTAFVWAILLGWLFFGESVTWSTMAGAGLIIVGCLMAARSRPKLTEPIEIAAI